MTAEISFTPSVTAVPSSSSATVALQREYRSDAPSSLVPSTGAGASLMEVSAFMTEQLKAQLQQQREHDKEQHGEIMRLIQEQKEEMKQLRDEAAEARVQALQAQSDAKAAVSETAVQRAEAAVQAAAAVSEAAVREAKASARASLQMRIETVHAAKLLSDDERDTVEDAIADSAAGDGDDDHGDSAVQQMIALSEKFLVDRAFARQLRRKYA
jgi:hypothetical protein